MQPVQDTGPAPLVAPIEKLTEENSNYRTTLWTGTHLQTTLMSIEVGHDIGLEIHPDVDQFLRVEAGQATVSIGPDKENMQQWTATDGDAVFVPAGNWHNLVSSGTEALKVYSIYSPVQHPHGTVHHTKEEAEAAEAAMGH